MRIRQTCTYILMAGSMLLFADASLAQKSMGGNTGAIGIPKNIGSTSHGNPPETVRDGPARSLSGVQTGLPSGRTSSGSLDSFGRMGTFGSREPFGWMETSGGLGASGNIGAPGSIGSPNIGGALGGVIGGR